MSIDHWWSYPQPREHELFRREIGGSQLVVRDEGPDEAQDELQVPIVDVGVPWNIKKKNGTWNVVVHLSCSTLLVRKKGVR